MNDTVPTPLPPTAWPDLPDAGMLDRILDIIAKETTIDRARLVPDATMESLNIASYDMVIMLMEMEEAFDAYIPIGEELSDAVYLADLVEVLVKQMQADPAGKPAAQ